MKAQQFYISEALRFFRLVLEKYGLQCVNEDGYDPSLPCVFYGMYAEEDWVRIISHPTAKVLIWAGRDAYFIPNIERSRSLNCIHIAISAWIEKRLERMGFEPRRINLVTTDTGFWKECPLGDKVYAYAPSGFYKDFLVDELAQEMPFEFIITRKCTDYTKEELRKLYEQCFVGLRLVNWDGCSATVTELGLMGRRCVWNGDTPNALRCTDKESIMRSVLSEANRKQNKGLHKSMMEYLTFDTNWLEI